MFVPIRLCSLLLIYSVSSFAPSYPKSIPRLTSTTGMYHHAPKKMAPFLQGGELQTLRDDINALKNNLKWSLATDDLTRVVALKRAIETKQKQDPDHVYRESILKLMKAKSIKKTSQKYKSISKYTKLALEARKHIDRLHLQGLWVGKVGTGSGTETTLLINVTYVGDELMASTVGKYSSTLNMTNMPEHQEDTLLFQADLSPKFESKSSLEPIALSGSTAAKWGTKNLERYPGKGYHHKIFSSGVQPSDTSSEGQLIMFKGFFSFLWIPTRQHVFFHRPEPNTVLQLLRDSISKEDETYNTRRHLDRCFQKKIDDAIFGPVYHEEDPEPFRRIATHADLEAAMRDTQIVYSNYTPVHPILRVKETLDQDHSGMVSSFLNFHRWMNYVDSALKPKSEGSSSETQH